MRRSTWDDLSPAVRAAIERETGGVAAAEIPSAGRNSDFAATLRTATGTVFCKGIADADSRRGLMHRHEAAVNPWLPRAVAPRLRWRIDVAGWLFLGFEHVPGRHANLGPGSPDLVKVALMAATLTDVLTDSQAEAPQLAEQWHRLSAWRRLSKMPDNLHPRLVDQLDELVAWESRAVEQVGGSSLVHTDLHSHNMLVNAGGVRVVDWAWSRIGAAAVDIAFLIARLIAAGHTPAAAERWAEQLPPWRAATSAAKTAYAVAIWGIWTHKSIDQPRPLWDQLVPAAQAWAQHCLTRTT
jgi:hypothetical protein